MSKKLVVGLVLLGVTVIVLLMSTGGASVNVIYTTISTKASYAYLGFTAIGVLIGLLLHK